MSKHFFIIHAWDESPESCWYPWLKQVLETKGYKATIPAMPNSEAPELNAWVNTLKSLVPSPNHETYFIGHSIGCQTILRYLADLGNDQQIGGAIFVAPWTTMPMGLGEASQAIAKPWVETPIDWQAAKAHCPQFSALFSDNDEWVPLSEEKIFQEKLSAKTQVIRDMGHFDTMNELPKLSALIQEIVG